MAPQARRRPQSASAYRDPQYAVRLSEWLQGGRGGATEEQAKGLRGLLSVAKLDTARREIDAAAAERRARSRPQSAPLRRSSGGSVPTNAAQGIAAVAQRMDVNELQNAIDAHEAHSRASSAKPSRRPQSARAAASNGAIPSKPAEEVLGTDRRDAADAADEDNEANAGGISGREGADTLADASLSALYVTTTQLANGAVERGQMGSDVMRSKPAKSQYQSAWGDGLRRSANATRLREDGTVRRPATSEYRQRFGGYQGTAAGDAFYESVQSRRLYYGDLFDESNCERIDEALKGASIEEKQKLVAVMRSAHSAVAHDVARKQSTMGRDYFDVRPTEQEAQAKTEFVANNVSKNTRQHINLFHSGETEEQRKARVAESHAKKASAAAARRIYLKKARAKHAANMAEAYKAARPRKGVPPSSMGRNAAQSAAAALRAALSTSQVPMKSFQHQGSVAPPRSVYSETLSNAHHAAQLKVACREQGPPTTVQQLDAAPFGSNNEYVSSKVRTQTFEVPQYLLHVGGRPGGKPARQRNATTFRRAFDGQEGNGAAAKGASDNAGAATTNRVSCGGSTAPLGAAALPSVLPEDQFRTLYAGDYVEPQAWGRDEGIAQRCRDLATWPTGSAGTISAAAAEDLARRTARHAEGTGKRRSVNPTTAEALASAQRRYAALYE